MPTYTLPDLRYDYGALEPHISGKIMELHHDKGGSKKSFISSISKGRS
jgi:superoxide dismutase